NVREPHTFGLIAGYFLRLMFKHLVGRPAADLHRAQTPAGIEIAAGVAMTESAGQIGKDHDWEFETLRLVHRHEADAVTALLENRRLGTLRFRGGPQLVDESTK